ncbi:hypothetical protein [Deinococcus sp. QL22]|uniref:hypothetical protein n=1 Tax=Deinococcus sp. QL22 TaxID=2939437 RepID=UPI002016FAA1|nr:hypothetical protein [Deinococcus sp. QL22]UQN06624.1 hypothetical protein M1R55_01490 [Deinococcus sp. QL22]
MTDAAAHAAANAEQLRVLREALRETLAPFVTTPLPPLECPASLPTGELAMPRLHADQGQKVRGASEKKAQK